MPVGARVETTAYCDDQPWEYVSVAWLLNDDWEPVVALPLLDDCENEPEPE